MIIVYMVSVSHRDFDQQDQSAMFAFFRVTQRSSRTLERMPERVATRYLNQAGQALAGWQEDFKIFCTGEFRWNASFMRLWTSLE